MEPVQGRYDTRKSYFEGRSETVVLLAASPTITVEVTVGALHETGDGLSAIGAVRL